MLSIIIPTIRLDRLPKMIDSLKESLGNANHEIICISPYASSNSLKNYELKWIVDKGNPVRCQQIGLCHAKGEYIHRAVDDSFYNPNDLDNLIKMVDFETVISMKFTETNETVNKYHPDFQDMNDPKFYKLDYHKQALKPYVPANTDLINFGIYPKKILENLGGWNCHYETIALAETDLSIRINFADIKVKLTDNIIVKCDWMPGEQGDHAPMHFAFPSDLEKYDGKYKDILCWEQLRININNWKDSPSVWNRRFNV